MRTSSSSGDHDIRRSSAALAAAVLAAQLHDGLIPRRRQKSERSRHAGILRICQLVQCLFNNLFGRRNAQAAVFYATLRSSCRFHRFLSLNCRHWPRSGQLRRPAHDLARDLRRTLQVAHFVLRIFPIALWNGKDELQFVCSCAIKTRYQLLPAGSIIHIHLSSWQFKGYIAIFEARSANRL